PWRVVHDRRDAMRAALAWGITIDDFTAMQARGLWQMLLAYFTQQETAGSIITKETLAVWAKGLFAGDPGLHYTVEALCFEVRRERIVVEGNVAVVKFSDAVNVPVCNPMAELQALGDKVKQLLLLGTGSTLKPYSGADFAAVAPPAEYQAERTTLTAGKGLPNMLAGYSFSAKSLAAMDLLLSLASGTKAWDKCAVPRRMRVVHVD